MIYRKKNTKRHNPLSALQRKADAIFSDYIRLRDTDWQGIGRCCTSGEIIRVYKKEKPSLYKYAGGDCGHYQERNKKSTRFEEHNANLQARRANYYQHGQKDIHAKFIEEKYGVEERERIDIKSKNIVHDYRMLLMWAIDHYSKKLSDLESSKVLKFVEK